MMKWHISTHSCWCDPLSRTSDSNLHLFVSLLLLTRRTFSLRQKKKLERWPSFTVTVTSRRRCAAARWGSATPWATPPSRSASLKASPQQSRVSLPTHGIVSCLRATIESLQNVSQICTVVWPAASFYLIYSISDIFLRVQRFVLRKMRQKVRNVQILHNTQRLRQQTERSF